VRDALGEILSRWGMMVSFASDRDTAMVRMHRAWDAGRPYAAALVDADLPPSDEISILDAMQESLLPPHGLILMLRPGRFATEASKYRQRGVSACLRKPIRMAELNEALRGALRLSRAVPREDTAPSRDAEAA
jgi:DNA-binding NtrC family response regulator